MRHGHPGVRTAVYHRGGGPARESGDPLEGKDPHHHAAGETLPKAAEVCQKKENRLR